MTGPQRRRLIGCYCRTKRANRQPPVRPLREIPPALCAESGKAGLFGVFSAPFSAVRKNRAPQYLPSIFRWADSVRLCGSQPAIGDGDDGLRRAAAGDGGRRRGGARPPPLPRGRKLAGRKPGSPRWNYGPRPSRNVHAHMNWPVEIPHRSLRSRSVSFTKKGAKEWQIPIKS